MLDHLGMHLDARNDGGDWRCPKVEKARRAGADKDDAALQFLLGNLAGKNLPGRDVAPRRRLRIAHDDGAVRVRRHLDAADPDGVEPGRRAEGGLAAGVGGAQHIGRGALRDPQRLCGKRRHEAVRSGQHHRHAPDHLVPVGQPVDGADPLGVFRQDIERRRRAVIVVDEPGRVVAGDRIAGLYRQRAAGFLGQRSGKDRAGLAERGGKRDVVRNGQLQGLGESPAGRRVGKRRQHLFGRGAVRLGKEEIEDGRRRARVLCEFRNRRQPVARPGPLAEPRQRGLVDIDDPDRQLRRPRPRHGALIGIEDEVGKVRERIG